MINEKTLKLKQLIIEQAMRVQKMLLNSISIMHNFEPEKINEIFKIEKIINSKEIEIDSFCTSILALYQPEAKHLRTILMCYKINNDLERMGDHLISTAKSLSWLNSTNNKQIIPEILLIAEAVLQMFKNTIEAFSDENAEISNNVLLDDDEIDNLNVEIFKKLIVRNCCDMEFNFYVNNIAKNYERIGDLATNIAEATIYLVNGNITKHHFALKSEKQNKLHNKW